MHAELQVRCIIKNPKEFLKEKEFIWDSKPLRDKTLADTKLDKPVTDKLDKPITDKLDKPLDRPDGGRLTGDDGGMAAALARIEARLSTLEASIQQSRPPAALAAPEPFSSAATSDLISRKARSRGRRTLRSSTSRCAWDRHRLSGTSTPALVRADARPLRPRRRPDLAVPHLGATLG